MTVDTTLILIAPEFECTDTSVREGMAAIAALSVGSAFGNKQELATAYLTAHMLTIRGRSGAGGSVKSLKEGDLAVTYGGSDNMDSYNSTSYGQEFTKLSRTCVFSARTRSV